MKCSYCQSDIEKGTGMMYVRKSGAVKYYCSTRCYKFDVIYHMKNRHLKAEAKAKPAAAPAK